MKKETLEEATERYIAEDNKNRYYYDFIAGAKWQAERMYSEEDLREAFRQGMKNMDYSEMYGWSSFLTEQEWFEQFKKE